MTELKREYVIPLRRKFSTVPKWRRSKKAMSVLKEFIVKHMKADKVVIGKELNEKIWENGIKNPPGKVSVIALKKDFNGIEKVLVNLSGIGIDSLLSQFKIENVKSSSDKTSNVNDKKTDVIDVEAEKVETKDEKEEVKKDE